MDICIFGAAPDTTNCGVTALGRSSAVSLRSRLPEFPVTIFDHSNTTTPSGKDGIGRCGARTSQRLWHAHTWHRIRLATRIPVPTNKVASLLIRAAAICDISGGDSFTDLYGPWRYRAVTEAKRFALTHRIPLILLPQTYGPFNDPDVRNDAARLCRGATQAWARDARSFEILEGLLGDRFNPQRHRRGVDVAFLLEKATPTEAELPHPLRVAVDENRPLIGMNISGLIYNDPIAARSRFGFKADYRELVIALVRWLLKRDDGDLVLVPHVLAPHGVVESDPAANAAIEKELAREAKGRLHVLPPSLSAGEIKWVISRCSWFCGTRMHATIAGLSSGISTATINYSDKARGVFEGCGLGDAVIDPRQLDTGAALEAVKLVYSSREEFGRKLTDRLPSVLETAEWQMDEIASCIRENSAAPGTPVPY